MASQKPLSATPPGFSSCGQRLVTIWNGFDRTTSRLTRHRRTIIHFLKTDPKTVGTRVAFSTPCRLFHPQHLHTQPAAGFAGSIAVFIKTAAAGSGFFLLLELNSRTNQTENIIHLIQTGRRGRWGKQMHALLFCCTIKRRLLWFTAHYYGILKDIARSAKTLY